MIFNIKANDCKHLQEFKEYASSHRISFTEENGLIEGMAYGRDAEEIAKLLFDADYVYAGEEDFLNSEEINHQKFLENYIPTDDDFNL